MTFLTNNQLLANRYFSTAGFSINNALYAWGNNSIGQLGQGNTTNYSSPVQIGTLNYWTRVSCGYNYFSLGIQSPGTLWSWGSNSYGQLGVNTGPTNNTSSPVQVGAVPATFAGTWSSVGTRGSGLGASFAIQSPGTLWAWGTNSSGRLGANTATTLFSSPIQVGAASIWTKISCGYFNAVAIQTPGTLWSWGINTYGGLGLNTTTSYSSPVQVGASSTWTQISCGYGHVLAIQSNGTLYAWGLNSWGQLGTSDQINYSSPVQIGALSNWSQVACGYYTTMAIQSNGTLWSWGRNLNYGELGLGDRTNRSSPVQVGASTTWIQIAGGYFHNMAIQNNGTLWAIGGYNGQGELGLNTTTASISTPIQVGALSIWTSLSAGYFTMAIQSNGTLWTCGYNYFGQLGLNTSTTSVSSFVQVGTSSTWTSVTCGVYNTEAIQNNSALYVWGQNNFGQLGLSDTTNRSSPVQLTASSVSAYSYLNNWTQVAAGNSHWLAVQRPGTLWSCGYNGYGQLGNNTSSTSVGVSTPVQVGALTTWTQVAGGNFSSYALQNTGTLWAWGYNAQGQLGQGNTSNYSSPVALGSTAGGWSSVAGYQNAIGIQNNGTLWAWGNNAFGQVGLNTSTNYSSPVQVGALSTWTKTTSALFSNLAIQNNGTLWSWGANGQGQLGLNTSTSYSSPVQVGALSTWVKVYSGYLNAGAIQNNGTLWMWGYNNSGSLGQGNTTNYSSPVQVGALTNWNSIASGLNSTLAIQNPGTLWSWGNNGSGQLGLNTTTNVSSPVQVGALSVWTQISCGYTHTAALQNNGTLWSWGSNGSGQLGLNTSTNYSSPVQVGALSVWTQVSCGYYNTAALQNNGTLWAWGNNSNGQLGQGNITNRSSPVQVGALSIWTSVTSFNFSPTTTAIGNTGILWMWGLNNYGQLGQQNTTNYSSPVQITASAVPPISGNWTNISVNSTSASALALQSAGTLWAWGYNAYGQLGNSNTTSQSSPVQIGALTLWKQIAAGGYSGYAIQSNGTLWAWGLNSQGQLGLNTTVGVSSPIQVPISSTYSIQWASLGPGVQYSTFAIQSNGTLWAWGAGNFGNLGLNTNSSFSSPVQVGTASNWIQAAMGGAHGTVIQSPGLLWTSGTNQYGQLGQNNITSYSSLIQVGNLSNWAQVACGYGRTMAVQSNGTLWGWGNNLYGQLGLGDLTNRSSPVQVGNLSIWSQISCGYFFTMALQSNGTLWGWGNNSYGVLGQNNQISTSSPIQFGNLSTWSQISTPRANDAGYVLLLQNNGTLWACGYNPFGNLGTGNTTYYSSPVQVGALSTWTNISTGNGYTIATQNNGTLWSWGFNNNGQLGQGDLTNRSSPTQIGVATNWAKVGNFENSAMAIQSNGTLWAWGNNNNNGQLGLNTSTTRILTPTPLTNPLSFTYNTNWAQIGAGALQLAAIQNNGTLWMCGYNVQGQLGVNTTTNISVLTQVGSLNKWNSATGARQILAQQIP
jgi:alpha-tubulin suppressor-like RCC1 family protein